MRPYLTFLVIAGLGALYYWQKHETMQPAITAKPAASQNAVAQPTQSTQPTQPPQISEHNWMKRSLDRASDVAQKARAQTKESQDP
jgi:hypothetical protein